MFWDCTSCTEDRWKGVVVNGPDISTLIQGSSWLGAKCLVHWQQHLSPSSLASAVPHCYSRHSWPHRSVQKDKSSHELQQCLYEAHTSQSSWGWRSYVPAKAFCAFSLSSGFLSGWTRMDSCKGRLCVTPPSSFANQFLTSLALWANKNSRNCFFSGYNMNTDELRDINAESWGRVHLICHNTWVYVHR